MSKGANRLSLGPIPKPEAVKMTITLSAELKGQLDAYAQVHARVYQVPVDAVGLVPHMLAAFIARDRGFRAMLQTNDRHSRSLAAADFKI
ncbi:MAG: DUF2274 domain-containing protein [Devosia sp.]